VCGLVDSRLLLVKSSSSSSGNARKHDVEWAVTLVVLRPRYHSHETRMSCLPTTVRLSSLPPRSCTLAIAWLMLTNGVDYDEAYLRVRQGRPICAPNTGFICSLLEWQRRRQQPPSSPLLYRTAWHVPLFPNDLVLKICIHESDRTNVKATLAALDSRGCYLLVVPATAGGGGRAKATASMGVIPSRVRGGFAPSCSSTKKIRT
ncbi:unnamed protein product, partial [Ectocarpus sp. 12 AP-2014]